MSISKHPIRCAGPHFQLCLFPTPLRMDVYDYFHMPFYIFPLLVYWENSEVRVHHFLTEIMMLRNSSSAFGAVYK